MDPEASPQPDFLEVGKVCSKSLDSIMEHVDAAIILVSWQNGLGRTSYSVHRRGNYFACKGMAQEWLEDEQAKTAAQHYGPGEPPDDADGWKSPSTE